MPTRHITRSPVKVTGTVPDGQKFESSIEEDFFLFLRFNRLVASFEDQLVTIEWQDAKGKIRDYWPTAARHWPQSHGPQWPRTGLTNGRAKNMLIHISRRSL